MEVILVKNKTHFIREKRFAKNKNELFLWDGPIWKKKTILRDGGSSCYFVLIPTNIIDLHIE